MTWCSWASVLVLEGVRRYTHEAMYTISRREALLAMALLAPGGRALYALQSKAKPATVTLIISGMT